MKIVSLIFYNILDSLLEKGTRSYGSYFGSKIMVNLVV